MSVATADVTTQALTITDRCDRCSAQAYVLTTLPNGLDLLWCGHHFASNEKTLLARGATVVDDSRHVLSA